MPLIRAFIAVNLASSVVEEIAKVQAALRTVSDDTGTVRWTRVENMHLTLKFLGDIEQDHVAPILTRLRRVVRGRPAFQVEARQLGGFPNLKRPRVIWAGLSADGLTALSKDLETTLLELHFPAEKRDFHPHVTLGRVRSQRGWDQVLPLVQHYQHTSFGTSVIDQVRLYRSDLRPTGAIYTALGSVPLIH
jgi:2'-5' RNA ligase